MTPILIFHCIQIVILVCTYKRTTLARMSLSEKAAALEQFVQRKKHVTFVDICSHFSWAKGVFAIFLKDYNVVLWTDISEELIDVIQLLCSEDRLWPHVCEAAVYMLDGGVLSGVPLGPAMKRYETPHWVPTIFNTFAP